ncbi:MAG: hypothetical protein LBF41_01120, partial [Deltaproteobacteria bacterium]|nr:hypothetical protein [Deltaproteobacteria bacterium]
MAVSLLAAALSLAPFAAGPAAAASPDKTNYQNSPITSSGRTIPRVLLVLAKDRKMFQQAYNDLTDMDGDGRIDTGFNPSVIYHGYFDPKGCYQYTEKGALTDYLPEYRNVSADQHFVRMTDTIEDDSQASLDSQKARAGLSSNVKAARAAHFKTGEKIGICQRGHDDVWGLFSGNWLNYVSMTRMDVIRKVLYGGKRRVDSDKVILESSFVPADAHVWGTDVLADNRWESETPLTNYYDIGKYTPFPKPKTDSAHYFARVRNLVGSDYDDFPTYPTLEYILDATPEIFKNLDGVTGKGRYFNWVLGDRPNPSPQYLKAGTKLSAFSLLVNPCSVHSVGEYENCRSYARDIKKPIGLLQKNGEGGQMLFGLLTGSYHVLSHEYKYDGTRIRGGVLRNHMGDISRDVDPETGAFTKDGIYHFLDILTIAAHRPKAGDMPVAGKEPAWSYTYEQAVSWGNPMGEMLYEGTRYFQRLTQTESGAGHTEASPKYLPPRDGFGNYEYAFWADQSPHPAELVTPHYGPSYIPSWAEIPALPAADCAKPVILVISDIDPDYDGDNFEKADLDRPILSSYLGTQGGNLPGFSLYDYLKIITANEGFNRGSKYFYSTGPYDNCLPKTLSNLIEVKGLCPNSPAFEGTYSAAAVAHYAHTHTFSSTGIEMPVDFYAVTMSSTFPALDFPVFDSSKNVAKKISIVPASMSDRDPDMTVGKVLSFLNYYVIDWQVDQRGTPYHVKVRVNFEDAVIGKDKYGESDWDSDMLMEYTIDLVTDSNAPLSKRLPDVIKMTGNVQAVRTLYTSAGKVEIPGEYPVKFSGALKKNAKDYYYFKTPNANSFTIEPAEVKGLIVATWKAGNNTTLSETLGYTISGTTRDGTYMDQGQLMGIAKNATPYTCNWPAGYGGATADDGTGCGVAFSSSPTGNYYAKPDSLTDIQHRTFEFNTDPATAGVALPNPLFLAATYGGFVDHNS